MLDLQGDLSENRAKARGQNGSSDLCGSRGDSSGSVHRPVVLVCRVAEIWRDGTSSGTITYDPRVRVTRAVL